MNIARAHRREHGKYSLFHTNLLSSDSSKNYALRHLYSLENTKHILNNLGFTPEQIKEAIPHITIDVWAFVVRIHIPKWIKIPKSQLTNYSILNGCKIIKGELHRPIKSMSRFVSKKDFINALIERNMASSDPYKLLPTLDWDTFTHKGVQDDRQLICHFDHIECTCHAYSGITKAFQQDQYALKQLQNHPIMKGQIPDKHVFAVWKYLKCHSFDTYIEAYEERGNVAHGYPPEPIDWQSASDEEVFAAAEQAKKDLGF